MIIDDREDVMSAASYRNMVNYSRWSRKFDQEMTVRSAEDIGRSGIFNRAWAFITGLRAKRKIERHMRKRDAIKRAGK